MLLATAILAYLAGPTAALQAAPAEDPSAPLRRFPVSILVHRQGVPVQQVSMLRLTALSPKDEIEVRVGDRLTQDWTFAAAYLSAGRKPRVESWNLWEKRWKNKPLKVGAVPDGDVVPLFFLVLNRRKDGRVANALRHALESNSEQIISSTAAFDATYHEQDRLYNFMQSYAALGPKAPVDPNLYRTEIDRLGADLGMTVDPAQQQTTPGELRKGLNVGIGVLSQLRKAPDDPQMSARIAQSQLPSPVADWLGLVSDLMRVFIRPRKDVKVTMVPASASEPSTGSTPDDRWMEFVTERVLESKDDAVPTLVFRPGFDRSIGNKPLPLAFERANIVAPANEVAMPIAAASRDLFTRPRAWNWQVSFDGKSFAPLPGARLLPGRGLVFPISDSWWGPTNERQVWVRANIGFQAETSSPVRVARAFAQQWALSPAGADLAVGDGGARLSLNRTGGTDQPFYTFAAATLTDSSGRAIPATSVSYAGSLSASFNLAQAAPGPATIRVQQEGAAAADAPVPVFVAPKRPDVRFSIAKGDNVLAVSGPDATMVKAVSLPARNVLRMENLASDARNFVLNEGLPGTTASVDVTYYDPARPNLEWKRAEPVSFGSPRPRFSATLIGSLPSQIAIGGGNDATWATATMPPGWFRTRQPIRLRLEAVAPFFWTHDLALNLGFGSANDVQSTIPLPEGPSFTIDTTIPSAGVTLSIDDLLPKNPMRSAGLVWLRMNRSDLASGWTVATLPDAQKGLPLRAVRLPVVASVTREGDRTRITFESADDVVGVKFPGDTTGAVPTLLETNQNGLTAYVEGPAGAMEFDLQLRDAPEATVHVKLTR